MNEYEMGLENTIKGECHLIGCFTEVRCKNLCSYHYNQKIRISNKHKTCLYVNKNGEIICKYSQRRRGLCSFNYNRLKRCEKKKCNKLIYSENLCRKHFKQYRARCVYGNYENTKIYCLRRMLCQFHYNKQKKHQKKDEIKMKLNETLLLEEEEEEE